MAKLIVPAMRYAVIRCRLRKEGPWSVSVQGVSRMIAARTTPQVAAISIADCVGPYRGKSTMPERRYQTDPTVLNTENTAHQYAANRARHASAMIMPSTRRRWRLRRRRQDVPGILPVDFRRRGDSERSESRRKSLGLSLHTSPRWPRYLRRRER